MISRLPTRPTARACVTWCPSTAIVTSMSSTSPGLANDRYWPVAQTSGRPLVPSSAEIAAAKPHPPNRNAPLVQRWRSTGSVQRNGLWVCSSPRNARESMRLACYGPSHSGLGCRAMTEVPWQGDACSLVDAFRRRDRSPREELDATLAAIDASDLNAFSHVHREQAVAAAASADVSLPFGGVPIGVKELDRVAG